MKTKRSEFMEARKSRLYKQQKDMDVKLVSSDTVPSDLIQDKSKPMVIVGSDVVSLYPNLTWEAAGKEVYTVQVSGGQFHQVGRNLLARCSTLSGSM